jgi:hypothetical protein
LNGFSISDLLAALTDPPSQQPRRRGFLGRAPASTEPPAPAYQPPQQVIGPGGVLPPEPPPFAIGPGGVTGEPLRERTPAEVARDDAYGQSVAAFGRRAGELAASSRYQPRYSRPPTDPLREQFGGVRPPIGPGGVVSPSATAMASAETGIPLTYLDSLIEHESGGDDDAKAGTTSATGPAQFTERTWLDMLGKHGARYGLPEGLSRDEMLALRSNRQWAALMTAELTHENRQTMTRALGRPITEREAYLGHFLGAEDAADLLTAAEARMGDARRFVDPESVRDNPQVFYEGGRYEWRTHPRTGRRYQHYLGGGRPRSAAEVVQRQGRNFGNSTLKDGRD